MVSNSVVKNSVVTMVSTVDDDRVTEANVVKSSSDKRNADLFRILYFVMSSIFMEYDLLHRQVNKEKITIKKQFLSNKCNISNDREKSVRKIRCKHYQ